MAEGARLEIVCTQKVPGVRISPSPPVLFNLLVLLKIFFNILPRIAVIQFAETVRGFFYV